MRESIRLSRLKVVPWHQWWDREPSQEQLQQLLLAVHQIESKVQAMCGSRKPRPPDAAKAELRAILNVDLPAEVLSFKEGWCTRLLREVDQDKELIRSWLNAAPTPRWSPPREEDVVLKQQALATGATRRPDAILEGALIASEDLLTGHIQNVIAESVPPLLPAHLALRWVEVCEVTEARPGRKPEARAIEYLVSDRQISPIKVVFMHRSGLGLAAKLWFHSRSKRRQRRAGFIGRRRATPVLPDVMKPVTPERPAALLEVVRLLDAAAGLLLRERARSTEPEVRNLEQVREDLRNYSGGPTILLRPLATWAGRVLADPQARTLLSSKMMDVLEGSNWPDLKNYFLSVALALGPSEAQKKSWYECFLRKCPAPNQGDVAAIADALEHLGLVQSWLPVVRAILRSQSADDCVNAAPDTFLAMLACIPATVDFAGLMEKLRAAISLTVSIAAVNWKPIIDALFRAGARSEAEDLLSAVAIMLQQACPSVSPGVWSRWKEHETLLDALWEYEALVVAWKSIHGVNERLMLADICAPLQSNKDGKPYALPASFFSFLPGWLLGDQAQPLWDAYQTEIAITQFSAYVVGPDGNDQSLRGCGAWLLRQLGRGRAVHRRLAYAFIASLQDGAMAPAAILGERQQRSLRALDLLCSVPADEAAVIRNSLELALWETYLVNDRLALGWRQWLETAATRAEGSNGTISSWATLCLRGILFETREESLALWKTQFTQYNSQLTERAFDECLTEFDLQLESADAAFLDEAASRLDFVRQHLPTHFGSTCEMQWFDYSPDLQRSMNVTEFLLLQSAALRTKDPKRFRARIAAKWPDLTVRLLSNGGENMERLGRLLGHLKVLKILSPLDRISVARGLIALLRSQAAPDPLTPIATMAMLFFERNYFGQPEPAVAQAWNSVMNMKRSAAWKLQAADSLFSYL